jgi:putative peptidoglycan lipid II flippase
VSNHYPGDDQGRTYQYPSRYDDRDQPDQTEQWEDEDPPRAGERQPAFYPAEPPGRQPAFYPAEQDEPDGPQPRFRPADPDEAQPAFYPAGYPAGQDEPQPAFYPAEQDEPQPRFRPAEPDGPQPRFRPAEPGRDDYGRHAAHEPADYEPARRDEPPRRDAESYRSPTTWSGPATPPAAPGREAGGWYQDDQPAAYPPPDQPAAYPSPDQPAVNQRPLDQRALDQRALDQRPPEPADQDQGERAWWDDAFRPAGPGTRAPGGPPAPGGPSAPPGRPGQAPRRPERPRPPSAQGYGVPPGELTQPIQIFAPQPRFIANPYTAQEDYLDVVAEETSLDLLREAPPSTGPSLARSTKSMAIGTLLSRVTGFLRTFVFVFALGSGYLADAYNNANTIPNAVYDVMIGGVLTSVVVPLLVKAAKEHRDGGEAYNQRMFTLTVLALGAVTIVATAAGSVLVDLYASRVQGREHELMVVFAYFFVPQIFFYGLSSLIGAILNTRNSFAAPMWTPIINNIVVIVVGLLFVVTVGLNKTPSTVPSGGVLLLGIGTTLGIIIQTVALVPALRRVGFRWRPRFDFRRAELAEIGRMATWMFGYVISTQIGFIVTTNVANTAGAHAAGIGVSAYNYSYALFLLPYAIIGVSVTTALLPRMSKNAAEGRYQQVSDDFSYSIRLSSVILVPAALLLAVLGAPLVEFLFSYGSMSTPEARYVGEAFGAFSLGLIPFVIFQLLLRVFYAMHDSRTPAIIGFLTAIATVIGNFVVLAILPPGRVVIGMAFVYGLTSVFSAVIAWRLLNRRIGSLDGRLVTRSLVRMHVATIPALIFALVTMVTVGAILHPGPVYGFIVSLVGGGGALLLYVIVAKALHLDELNQLMRMVSGRFGRRSQPSPGR